MIPPMRVANVAIATMLALWTSLAVGVAVADASTDHDGVGVCTMGIGADKSGVGAPVFVGVTYADPVADTADPVHAKGPTTWDNATAFETECCSEAGLPADCFTDVGP